MQIEILEEKREKVPTLLIHFLGRTIERRSTREGESQSRTPKTPVAGE